MTPAHTDSPLRRSEVGVFREGVQIQNVMINDDEEERRQARRRTILLSANDSSPSTFEDNETLKKCLEIYNGNKLSKDNAWSLSLIDTLSTLLDKHHKSLNNFKVAGSSLEASSKVYGLRVDSIHTDVLRMSAGLNAQKFSGRNLENVDDDDDKEENAETGSADFQNGEDGANEIPEKTTQKPKPKKSRKQLSTVTKNKDSLNARLDTVPLTDPVFGKLNSIVGSINSSNRLLQNILLSTDSELRLGLNFPFWDGSLLDEIDYTEEVDLSELEHGPCKHLFCVKFDELKLRPMQSAYVITDTPDETPDGDDHDDDKCDSQFGDDFNHEMSMAFDINAECEPIPPLSSQTAIVDVDFGEYSDLTTEERVAINQCKGLRKAPVLIEDLRPVDSSSKLEYSYRPLDKISQFWAGPSHWKFKKRRTRPGSMGQRFSQVILGSQSSSGVSGKIQNQRGRTKANKHRSKQVQFGEYHDDLFVKLDEKSKLRKANVQKKWDHRKLKLPTDLQIEPNMFYKFEYAPGVPVEEEVTDSTTPDLQTELNYLNNDTDDDGVINNLHQSHESHFGDDGQLMNTSSLHLNHIDDAGGDGDMANKTVLEIATDFEGAPTQVTKIIVPFAKRAKIIDMKNLKKSCSKILTAQLKKPVNEDDIPKAPDSDDEKYSGGVASFQQIYNELPSILTPTMAESLSPSVAFYSILHLANDFNLRLIPQDDLNDFKIRQVMM